MTNLEVDRQRNEKRRHLLARMAGNIAAGMVSLDVLTRSDTFIDDIAVARDAVAVARAILAELER